MAKMAAPTPPKRTTARPKRALGEALGTARGGYVGDRRGHPVHDANNKNATPSFRVNHNTD